MEVKIIKVKHSIKNYISGYIINVPYSLVFKWNYESFNKSYEKNFDYVVIPKPNKEESNKLGFIFQEGIFNLMCKQYENI